MDSFDRNWRGLQLETLVDLSLTIGGVLSEEELVEEFRGFLRSRGVDGSGALRRQMTPAPGRALDPLVQHLVDGSAKTLEEAKPT